MFVLFHMIYYNKYQTKNYKKVKRKNIWNPIMNSCDIEFIIKIIYIQCVFFPNFCKYPLNGITS